MDGLSIGELAKQAGVHIETLRYYERRGLLDPPPRTRGGYRVFPRAEAQRIRFIKRAQELGFTLKEIAELLDLRLEPDARCEDIRRRAEVKIEEIDRRIGSLRGMKRALKQLTAACSGGGPVDGCPILRALGREGD